ncbi:hypothetical protein B5M42_019205 [Paenibacillus athensensis]|uniref:DUF6916 domain-containing protein n=1 Tax=Paenibacillus athensensis TaxID=1967502 RepID=A0A4Y8PS10_9BACL|nr:hypothetical protein [Paenibacillus athensensis]MCD1260933.1 hypothetical protein [Paenibacillus athensensis]
MKTFSDAEALQGSNFQVVVPQGDSLTLEVTQVKDRGSNDAVEQFSIVFKGALDAPLQQGLYQLQHETLGAVDWMLVPVGRDMQGNLYEAVFNLLKNQE